MKEIITIEKRKIEEMIYEIRGKQVILDSDLAKLYQTETRIINQAVKRNIERFPEDFCFRLTKEEIYNLRSRSQSVILNDDITISRGSNIKYLPYVFSEQGIAMLSSILKTDVAVKVSISIMRTFVKMRHYMSYNFLEQSYINNMVLENSERIKVLEDTFSKFNTFNNELFFEGQIYDAHSLLLDIFNSSKKSIIIIDNYVSKELLDVLSRTNKEITIYSKNMDKILIKKFQSQYNNLTIKNNDSFHDRFIIIDDKTSYHCSASFKDMGKKCFAISKIDNIEMIKDIQSKL